MKFQNFKVEDENDNDNAGFTSKRSFNFKLKLNFSQQKFEGTTQSLQNFLSKKLHSNDHANNNENDDAFHLPIKNVNKISTSVTSTSQTTNGNGLELQTLFEPKEVITVTPVEVQSQLNFDDIFELPSSIVNDEDFTKSVSDNHYVTSSEKLTSEHKQQSNNESLTTMPVELFSVIEQTDNPSNTLSTLSSSNNDNGITEKSDEFGVIETISFDQDLEEPAKITAFHLTSTSSTTPSLNTQIDKKLTSKELQNSDIITTNNENDEILYSTTANVTNQLSTVKTNSYDAEHSTKSSLTTILDMKLLRTDLTNTGMPTGGLNFETNNYEGNTNVATHPPTNDGRVTVTSETELNVLNFTDSKLGTWPELTSKILDESMPKLSSVTDELLGGLPSKVLTDENMAISNTGLKSTATFMEGNKESKKLTQVKDNTNGEEVTSRELLTGSDLTSAALSKEYENLPTQIISETSFKVGSNVEYLPLISQNTHKMFNYFKMKTIIDEDMIPTQPLLATEEDILSKILKTTHYPFISNEFKITTDENMILQDLGKTIVSNFEVNTESSTHEKDTTAEKVENILITKNNVQEETQLNGSANGDVVSEVLEFTTIQTHTDENKDSLTSNELLTSSELTTMADNFPSILKIKDGSTITLSTLSKEHDNVPTQIIGKIYEVTGDVEKNTQDRFNQFMQKKTTNEDMVSNVPLLATEIESLLHVLKTTRNPFIENKLKTTTDKNMVLHDLETTIVSNFEKNTESSTVSALITSDEKDTTAQKVENTLMTKNSLQEGTQLNGSTNGNVVSEVVEFTTIEENKDLLSFNELLTSSKLTTMADNFHFQTLSKEHDNVPTQIIGKIYEVTGDVEKTNQDRFNQFMFKKITNEDMVSSVPLLTTEIESLSQIVKTTHNPFIENKLKTTTDENMVLHELEKTILSNFELNAESSTVSALVTLDETDTTEEKLENILMTKSNSQEETQFSKGASGDLVSEGLEFTTFKAHIDGNKDLLTSNELLTSSEATSISDNFPSNLNFIDRTTITSETLSQAYGKTSEFTEHIEKTTRDKFNELMLKKTTNEDMVSNVPVLATEIESLSQVLKTTHNPFIENKLITTTDENMSLKELEKTIVSNFELNTKSSISALTTAEILESILMTKSNSQEDLKLTTFQTHIDENKASLTSIELLTSSEDYSSEGYSSEVISDNFTSNLKFKDGTAITLSTLSEEHDNGLTQIISKTSEVTGEVEKTTRDRFNELMLKKTTNEDMVASQPVLIIGNKLKVTTDKNMIIQEPEKITNSAGNIDSLTTSGHVSQIATATETLPNDITVTVKLPEEKQLQESTNKKAETEFAAETTKNENESQVWPDLTTTVEIAPHILTKTTIGLFNKFEFKDTTANEDMASLEHHSVTTLTNLPHILKTTKDILVVNQLTETTNENMITMEETTSNLLVTSQNINTSKTEETTNIYAEGSKEPSATLNVLPTLIEDITRSENLEHTVTDETHFKENADSISKEEDMNVAAKLKGEYTNTMEVIPHISKTTNSLLKNFLVEETTDEDMIVHGPEKISFQENKELPTESEHALEITTVGILPNIVIATTKLSEENQFQETTNKFSENKVLPDLTTTVKISSHILTETSKNLFQEFQLEETTVNEDMTPIESHSTTIFTKLPHIFETPSKLFEEITNEDMLSKETELTRLTTTMEENNELLLTSNVPITAEKIDTSEAKETSNILDMFSKESELHSELQESSTILNELLTLTEKPTESKTHENIPATTELTKEIQFKGSSTTNMVSEVHELSQIASHTEKNISIKDETTITRQASEHISETTYNIFKIFEPQGSTDEDMAIMEPSILPQISKISPDVFLENELKKTTNNKDISSVDFKVITSTISAVENESSHNMKAETETLPILSSNIPNVSNIVTETHEIIDQNKFKSKATEEISDLVTSNKIILNTHTIGIGTSVENLPHSSTTIHTDLVSSKFTDFVKTLEPNTENLSKTTHDINFSSTHFDKNLELSEKISAYTGTTQESSNLNKEQLPLSTSKTNSELSLLSSSSSFPEHTRTSNDFQELTTKSYGNENGDWVTWPEMNSTSEKNTVSTLITKLTISDLLTTENSNTNEVTEIFQDVIALSTKSAESSSETFPTLPDELQLDFNQTSIEHSTNLSTIENSFVSTITPLVVKSTSKGYHFQDETNNILTNYISTVEAGETLDSVQAKDQYTSSSPNTIKWKTELGGITSPNLILSTISVKTHEPNADNQSKATQNSDFSSTRSDNNLESPGLSKEQLTSTSQSSLLSSSNRLQGKTGTFLDFEELPTKSYGNENGDWVTWPEINSTSDKNTVSTLLTKFTISDSPNTEIFKFNDVTEIYQDAIKLSTTSKESSSETYLTLPEELQLGFSQTPIIEDSTNLSQISTATTLNINSFSTTDHLKDITNNILTNYVSPIGIDNTLHTFNTKDQFNDTDHLLHNPKFEKTTITDIMNVKSSGQKTSHFEHTLTIPDKIEPLVNLTSEQQGSSTVTTINPLFSLTEGIIITNNHTEVTKAFAITHKSTLTLPEGSDQANSKNTEAHITNIMHKPSQITDIYTSTLLNPTHVDYSSHSENLRAESGNTLTLMISDEITQSNQASIGSTLANQNYQTEQHDTNLMHNSDESAETHTSTLVKSTENNVNLSHNQTLQAESGNKLTSDLNLTSFATEVFLATTLSTPNGDSKISENNFITVSHEKVLEHTENTNNPTVQVIPKLELLDEEFKHFSAIGTHITTTSTFYKTIPIIHATSSGDELLVSHTEHTFLNTEDILAKQSEIIKNSPTTLGLDQGMVDNQIIHSVSINTQPLTTENAHPEFPEISRSTVIAEHGLSHNKLSYSVHAENQPLTIVNEHPEFSESSHTTLKAEQEISHNELTHSVNIEYQSQATANEHPQLSESGHTTISAEHELSHNELTHSVHTENQPLTNVNEHPEFSESSHTILSSEHETSINELTHSANTENQQLTTENAHPHFPESGLTTLNAEQGISFNELTHSVNIEYQSLATANEHPLLSESGHTTISAEHELSHNELTHSVQTKNQPLTNVNEHPEFSESSHTTLNSEHGTSINELTHSANTENQQLTTENAHPHFPESGHTTLNAEQRISLNELTHSVNIEYPSLATANEHPLLSESGHTTISAEHELSHSELTHSVHTENQPLTNVNEHPEFSESSHTILSSEHGTSINELTHSANTENQQLTTENAHLHFPESGLTTLNAEQGISFNELTHSVNIEHQSQATPNEHPLLSESGHSTISAEYELSQNKLTHSVHTESQPLTTLNENLEFSESSHITLSSEHGISINDLTHSANTENQPLTTVNALPHLQESDYTAPNTEQGISLNELTHSVNIEYQSQVTANEHSQLSESGHTTISAEHELSHNELTYSVHTENHPFTNVNEHPEFLESNQTTLSLQHGITHLVDTENQPLSTVSAHPHLPESANTTLNAEQELPPNELTHSVNTEHQTPETENEHPHLTENGHPTISAEHELSHNELTHLVHTESQPLTTLNENLEISESSHITLSSEHGISINDLTHSANTENQPITTVDEHPHLPESDHTTPNAEQGLSHIELTHSVHTESQPLTTLNENLEFSESSHITLSSEHGISINDLIHSANIENQPITTVDAHPHLPDGDHTTPNAEQGISQNELTHSINIEYQSQATANEHPQLPESGHTTISAEHELSHNELTYSVHAENHALTNVNEHSKYLESSHTPLSSEHGISIDELTHLVDTENQPLSTVSVHPHLPESSNTTLNTEQGLSPNELTHSLNSEHQTPATENEHLHLTENGHPTISTEHELSHNELTHSVHTESQPLTTLNENLEFSESSLITLSSEHGISINDLTHSANTENQQLTTENAHPHFPESDHTTTNAEPGLSHNELTHSVHTESQPLTTLNENLEFSESSHITLSSEHGISINDLTHSANIENQPITTVDAHPHLPDGDHTTPNAEQGISQNELTHSINIEYQSQATANEHPQLPESGHTTISAEHELSHNELTYSVHAENHPLTNVNEHSEYLESSHTPLSSEHGISIDELTHLVDTENQPLSTVSVHPHLPESSNITLNAEHGLSPNKLTHSLNSEHQQLTTENAHPHFPESDYTTTNAEPGLSHNELTHSVHTESQPLTTLNEHLEFSESSHTTLSLEHGISLNELTHSENTENQLLSTVNAHPHLPESAKPHSVNTEHQTPATESEHLHLSESGHTAISVEHELSHNELSHSLHTENHHLTNLKEHTEFSESSHTTLSSKHGTSINELTHSVNTENQPITIVNSHPYLSESSHTTVSVEYGISSNTVSHSVNTENQPLTTVNNHPDLSEVAHTTLSGDHEISHNELTHSINTENHLPTTMNEHPEFSGSSHTRLTLEHGVSMNELTHSENTESQPLSTGNAQPQLFESSHSTLNPEHELSTNELTHSIGVSHLPNTETQSLSSVNTDHSQNIHATFPAELEISDNKTSYSATFSDGEVLKSTEFTTIYNSQIIHATLPAELEISDNETTYSPTFTDAVVLKSTEFTTIVDITKHSAINQTDHTTTVPKLEVLDEELIPFPSKPLTENTTYHPRLSTLPEISQNVHNISHADLGVTNSELLRLLNTTTQLSPETTEHQITDNLHTSFSSTPIISNAHTELINSAEVTVFEDITKHSETNQIDHTTDIPKLEILDEELIQLPTKPLTENTYHTEPSILSDINQNKQTNFHADLGITSSELPYLLNTATQLLSSETTVSQVADNLHTSLGSIPIIINSSALNDTDQNIHTTSHADLGISSNELSHLVNTATLLSTETIEHHITDDLHTSLSSTPIVIHGTVSNDIDQNIHTTSHADVGMSSNELSYLVNTATTLLSPETAEYQITDNFHTSFGSTSMITQGLASNDINQNIHTIPHEDLGISNNESPHLLNTATQLLSTDTVEHQITDNLHTSFSSTPIISNADTEVINSAEVTVFEDITKHSITNQINHTTDIPKLEILDEELIQLPTKPLTENTFHTEPSILSDINQNKHTNFHADFGITSSELPHLLNTATQLLSSETTVSQTQLLSSETTLSQLADNLHTSLGSTPIIINGSDLNDIDQNIYTTTHADLGMPSNKLSHLVNTATTLLSTETTEHHIADNLHTSFDSTSININVSALNDITQNIHTTIHADLGSSSSELQHLSSIATQLLPNENADHQIPNNMHTTFITPTTFIFRSTESGQVLTNTEQGVMNSIENITKHSEINKIDHTTDIPKIEILDEELIHLPNKLSTDHLVTSGNELSRTPSTTTKPLTNLNIVSPTSHNIPIGITISSTLIVQNTNHEAKSNTQNKFAHLTEDLAKHSEVAHSNHNTLISTLGITSHDLLNTENQQISDNHSGLINPSTSIIGNESKFFNTDKEFYNSTEFSVYEDLAKHLQTTQINQTTVVPKLEILDEEFIQIPNKSILLTENINQITNHINLTTLPVTFSEFIPLPTITLFEQMFSEFIHNNTLNYTKPEEEELTTERLKSTLVEISNQNLNVSSEILNEHFLGTESSDISSILTTNTNFITNAFSHKETNNQFLKTHSMHSEFETLEFSHSTESFKENLKSFHEWLGQPSVNGTDQTTMLSNVIESTLSVKTNSDMEVNSTNDLKHFTTLTHSTLSHLPNITNEDIFYTSQHHLGTEPTIFTSNGAKEDQSNSNPENLNPNQQNQTLLPVITTSTFAYSQNYHNENFTTNEELPHVSVSREMMSFEITTLLPLITTTSTVAYSHNYHSEDFSVNEELSHVTVSHVTTFPSSIISTDTSTTKLETSPNLSTMQSLAFHNKISSTEMHNMGNFLKTDQAGNNKNDSGASSTKVSEIPTHECIENLSKTQNKTSGDTFHSNNKNIDNNSSETSNLTINNLKTTGKEFEKNSTEGMWQWPGVGPEGSKSNSSYFAGDHAKITQPNIKIPNAKFEPADNEILFTSKPNLSTTALEHASISPNLETHVTHPKLQPEVNKNIPPLEILTGQHNVTVGNTNVHQSNGKLQNAPIYINLPVYPVDSTYPLLLKFNEYYSSTTKSSIIIDDEATDKVINTEQFRTMKFEDFNAVTEFPSTTIKMEEPAISKLISTNQILSNSIQLTTALNQALKTDHIESNQQSIELTTTSEVTHVGKAQDKLPDVLNENAHQNQQNAELTTKSENVHLSSTEEKINQSISTGVTEFATLGSSIDVTHIENTLCTSSNTLNKEIGSEEINKTTESSMMNAHSQPVMIISEFPKFQEESTCNYTDYLSQNNCMCSMDNLIKDLRMKLVNNFLNFSIDNFTCPIFTHVEAGIFLGNDSVPQISKSRRDIVSDMYSIVVRREIVDYQNMDKTLNEQLELKNTENDIFATPGMKILIPCISTNNLSEGSTNYSWTFSDNLPLTEGKIQETEGTLTIDNVAPQDAGNYTCIATSSNANRSDEKRYEHHLFVVSIPSYRLQTTLLYNSTEKCQSGDADIISLYLPHSLEGLICGNYFKVCSIEVKNPKCLNATQYTSVNLTVIIEPINVIMPAINNSVCDVGCEMKIYTHVVLFIIKNLEAVLKLPVFFRLSYRQQKLMPTEVVIKKTRQKLGTEAPKLIITCPPGFGYYKKTHVCGTCGRNTFSRGDETFCSPCPSGQYQPMVGSKSCLICATPLQDPYCLRVMYSNTHKFRVLIGITATVLVVLIILLLCIKSMKKSTNSRSNSKFGRESYLKNRRQSKRRSREPDCEMQDSQPLLESSRDRKYKGYNRKPPEPPPPDFY